MSWRRVVLFILVAFAIYAIFTAPTRSADVAGQGWDLFKQGANALGTFFDRLIES